MIVSIVHFAILAGDDAPCAPVILARRDDRVFVVIAIVLIGQNPFPIFKNDAIAVVRKGTILLDQFDRVLGLVTADLRRG